MIQNGREGENIECTATTLFPQEYLAVSSDPSIIDRVGSSSHVVDPNMERHFIDCVSMISITDVLFCCSI